MNKIAAFLFLIVAMLLLYAADQWDMDHEYRENHAAKYNALEVEIRDRYKNDSFRLHAEMSRHEASKKDLKEYLRNKDREDAT